MFAENHCVKSSHGNNVCFEFELDKQVMKKKQKWIDNIADFCFSTKYDRLVLEDTKAIENGKGDRYTIKVLTGNSNDKFELDYFRFKQSKLFNCTNNNKNKLSSPSYFIENFKNVCIAMTKHKVNCYNIQNKDMKNFCLGVTAFPINCYQIEDSDLQKVCTAKTANQVDCYSIKDKNIQNFCIGITKLSTNCYQINDSSLKKYCIAISSHNYDGCF
jgi:hypothetical protein